jgi:hypothetical protein
MKANKTARSYERKADHITPVQYSVLQQAVDHFNKQLFDGSLPDVFITYQRKAHSNGSYAPDRYSGRADEIRRGGLSLNPDNFIGQTDEQIAQTLVSLMAECWQNAFGTMRSARGYHNKEWAAKMKAIGLQPSSTGGVGGKETGQRMSSYIIPDGPFANAFTKLAATGWKLNLQSAHRPGPQGAGPNTNKSKFSCEADCGQNAWGKPSLDTVCVPCLIAKLEAAGIDVAILDGVRMRDIKAIAAAATTNDAPSYETITPVADIASYDTNIATAEPANPKRGRPKGSKNKKPKQKTAGQELKEALSRLETHKRKQQQQNGDDSEVELTSKWKISRLRNQLWRLLEHRGGALKFLSEQETAWLRSVDREHPKLGDYYEIEQINRWVTARRRKKRAEQKESKSYEQTQPLDQIKIEQTSGADNVKSIVPTNPNPAD